MKSLLNTLKISSHILPKPSAYWALKMFLTPVRHAPPAAELPWLERAERLSLGNLRVYRWRQQPSSRKVLLVHGWSGRGSQLFSFIEPLLASQFEVYAVDGPAHGESFGKETNAGEFSRSLLKVQEQFGPFEALIGHSFGAGCMTFASTLGLQSQKMVLIACPSDYEKIVDGFLDFTQISPKSRNHFRQILTRRAQLNPQDLKIGKLGSQLPQASLIIHDQGDKEVPFNNALEILEQWKGSRLHQTSGLGHRRILKDPQVIKIVSEFLIHQSL